MSLDSELFGTLPIQTHEKRCCEEIDSSSKTDIAPVTKKVCRDAQLAKLCRPLRTLDLFLFSSATYDTGAGDCGTSVPPGSSVTACKWIETPHHQTRCCANSGGDELRRGDCLCGVPRVTSEKEKAHAREGVQLH